MSGKQTLSILVLSLGLSVLFAGSAPAQASAGAKIGVADIQGVIVNTNEGKKDFEALQQKFSPKKIELENLNAEIEKLNASPQNPVLWAEPSSVITKQLIDAYNAQSNVPASVTKPAGAAPPRPAPTTP